MKIVVLAGGISAERDVSLVSGSAICKALIEKGHKAVLVDLFFGINVDNDEELNALFENGSESLRDWEISTDMPSIDEIWASRKLSEKDAIYENSEIGPNVINVCKMADFVFLGLHGGIGENGKLQALFDIYGIRYTGSGSIASALAMHKGIAKQLFVENDVPAADYKFFTRGDDTDISKTGLTLPLVVKICSGGSSLGVFVAKTKEEYSDAIKKCFEMENEVLVERYIKGREFGVPVIDGKAYPVLELIPKNEWFDYECKYQDNQVEEICPAHINDEITEKLQRTAEKACEVLGVEVYARPDFIVDENGNIYCMEINTLPGMTPTSQIPNSAKVAGLEFGDLCEKILEISMKKYEK